MSLFAEEIALSKTHFDSHKPCPRLTPCIHTASSQRRLPIRPSGSDFTGRDTEQFPLECENYNRFGGAAWCRVCHPMGMDGINARTPRVEGRGTPQGECGLGVSYRVSTAWTVRKIFSDSAYLPWEESVFAKLEAFVVVLG